MRHLKLRFYNTVSVISIHAPREGCDYFGGYGKLLYYDFNPRTPRGVRRGQEFEISPTEQFQSTHPARGATYFYFDETKYQLNFNPRTPRGVRLRRLQQKSKVQRISIHAPREGCDFIIHFDTTYL